LEVDGWKKEIFQLWRELAMSFNQSQLRKWNLAVKSTYLLQNPLASTCTKFCKPEDATSGQT